MTLSRTTLGWTAVLVIAAVARLHALGQEPFWTDEVQTLRLAGIRYGPEVPPWHLTDLAEVTQGPLFMLLVHVWARLVGVSEAALRLLPVACGLLTLPFLAALARRWLGGTAWIGALCLAALSPFHVWYSRELRGYTLVMLAAVVATWLLDVVWSASGRRRLEASAGWLGATLIGLGASFTMGFVVAVHALVTAPRLARSGWRAHAALAAGLVLIALLARPWLEVIATRYDLGRLVGRPAVEEGPLRGASTFPLAALPYTFYAFAAGFSLGPTLDELHALSPLAVLGAHGPTVALVTLGFGGLALAGWVTLWRRRRPVAWRLTLWLVVPVVLAACLAMANVKPWNARYVAVAWPAFVLLVAQGASLLGGRRTWVLLATLLAIELVSVVHLHVDARYWKEDYRSAGAYLDTHLRPGDAMIGEGAPRPTFYYMQARPAAYVLLHPHRIADPDELARRVERVSDGAPRVWLVRARVWLSDPENEVGALLGRTRTRVDLARFRGVTVECYR